MAVKWQETGKSEFFGANIYYWDALEQRELLRKFLLPIAKKFESRQIARLVWQTSFDARGPHLFTLFQSQGEARKRSEVYLFEQAKTYLGSVPSLCQIPTRDLEQRHTDCQGRTLCYADEGLSIRRNNVVVTFSQFSRSYPFDLVPDALSAAEVAGDLHDITIWGLQVPDAERVAAAMAWSRGINAGLSENSIARSEFWRRYAASLLRRPTQIMDGSSTQEFRKRAEGMLRRSPSEALDRLWRLSVHADRGYQSAVRLVSRFALRNVSTSEMYHSLRQFQHGLFVSLGLTGAREMRFALYLAAFSEGGVDDVESAN